MERDLTFRSKSPEFPEYYLGDPKKRYFSNKYRDVNHTLKNIVIENGAITSTFDIMWPDVWQEKKGATINPHISTFDLFLISTRLVELFFSNVLGKQYGELCRLWVSEVSCKVGSQMPCGTKNKCTCSVIEEDNSSYTFKITIEKVIMFLRIEKPKNSENSLPFIVADNNSYFENDYKLAERGITKISINDTEKTLNAYYNIKHNESVKYNGLSSYFMPCLTYCDLFLTGGQLSQILLFCVNKTTREDVSNLWLRSMKSRCESRIMESVSGPVSVIIKNTSVLNVKNDVFHCADVEVDFNNGMLKAEWKAAYNSISI